MRIPFSIIVIVAAASQIGATDCGQITRDQGFDLWCGTKLCYWDLERGAIKKVGTWNKADSAVEMIGDDVAFSQLTDVNSGDTTCIRFEMIANVDENAEVRLDVDVFDDGFIDYSERIPTSHWKPLSYVIPIAPPYDGVRFRITKKGQGRGVVAQLQAEVANHGECAGLEPINSGPYESGAPCFQNEQCTSHLCIGEGFDSPGACSDCDPSLVAAGCTGGKICGYAEPSLRAAPASFTCVAPGSRELAEQCWTDDECETGVCTGKICSTCGVSDPCTGEVCAAAYPTGPSLCSPGGHKRITNEPCAADADCVSNNCIGTDRMQCGDGRPCESSDDCPAHGYGCFSVGIQGGRCE